MIDSHAHLDSCADPPSDLLARARVEGVTRVVSIGSGIPSCHETLAIAESEAGVLAALGIHPHQAGEARPRDLEKLGELLAHPRVVAVGETGLDHYRDYPPRERQEALFREHVALAAGLGKALVVHSRAAEEDTLAVLEDVPATVPVVLHCFSSPALLPAALERGYYVSFAGNVTYPKAADLRAAACRVPVDRLLAETDSPYLAPQAVRGRPNEPAYVTHVLRRLAEARAEDPVALERQIDRNADVAFGSP